ncbi:DUF167 domain-containing protein [Croceicoccus gelatinilyticus]|uniref:DUF167 domain-containing protein n=1 Tax=Croceicoccus gelatinilyticus TaxID=2835536 RepID=UPI001BD142CA|nr:DUF167 domain-containing protein [Croceicoccus gelatinilyticus]MBS7669810.1 DUF167 domain-containing protein [Croceicoccus gelatinilyticus]
MARPKPSLPPAEAIRTLVDADGLLPVRVTPNASHEALMVEDGQLRARVTVVPEDGKANKAVIKLVAKAMGIAPGTVELVRGATSRDKVLKVG